MPYSITTPPPLQQLELRHPLDQLFVSCNVVERVKAIQLDHSGFAALYDSRSWSTRSRWRLGDCSLPKKSVNFTGRSRLAKLLRRHRRERIGSLACHVERLAAVAKRDHVADDQDPRQQRRIQKRRREVDRPSQARARVPVSPVAARSGRSPGQTPARRRAPRQVSRGQERAYPPPAIKSSPDHHAAIIRSR